MTTLDSTTLEALGAFVREQRQALGLTQTQLGERLGWAQERLSTLEHGRYGMPSLPMLERLATALEMPLAKLLAAAGYADIGLATDGQDPVQESRTAGLLYTLQRLLHIEAIDLKDVLDQASDQIAEAMGADKIDAFLYEPSKESLIAAGTSNTPMGRRQHDIGMDRMPIANRGPLVETFETGMTFRTGDATTVPGVQVGVIEGLGVRSIIAVRFELEHRSGLLVAESAQADHFSDDDLQFFEAVARWVGIVGHRAELVESVTREAVEEGRRLAAEEMMTLLAHDLGNLITPLKGHLALIRKRAERERRQQDIQSAEDAARVVSRFQHLIDDLMDAARLEQGIFTLSIEPVDLVHLTGEVSRELESPENPVHMRAPNDLELRADPVRLAQAIQNLVANAIEHSSPGVPVFLTIQRERRDQGELAVVTVRDNGPGIEPNLLPALFRPFTSGPRSTGLGLGLFLARSIAEAHGGTVDVESTLGRGTSFHLFLPIERHA